MLLIAVRESWGSPAAQTLYLSHKQSKALHEGSLAGGNKQRVGIKEVSHLIEEIGTEFVGRVQTQGCWSKKEERLELL